jgi:hypothetical protein
VISIPTSHVKRHAAQRWSDAIASASFCSWSGLSEPISGARVFACICCCNEFDKCPSCSQYALRSVYPASYTHIGQEFGAAVSLDTVGSLFVGAPNQLTSGATETQDGAVHVLQLHSSPNHATSRPSTTINSRSPLNKPIGTSCASLLQQVSYLQRPPPLLFLKLPFFYNFVLSRATLCPACTSSSPLLTQALPFQFTAICRRRVVDGACATPVTASAMSTCLATMRSRTCAPMAAGAASTPTTIKLPSRMSLLLLKPRACAP